MTIRNVLFWFVLYFECGAVISSEMIEESKIEIIPAKKPEPPLRSNISLNENNLTSIEPVSLATDCAQRIDICGSKCMWYIDEVTLASSSLIVYNCQCGNITMTNADISREGKYFGLYCCNQIEPCQLKNDTITCTDGILTNINDKCGSVCPSAKVMSVIAISTDHYINKQNDNMCYEYGNTIGLREKSSEFLYYNKIFMNLDVSKDTENFAKNFCSQIIDNSAHLCVNTGKNNYKYNQCYRSVIQPISPGSLVCLNRADGIHGLFKKKIFQRQRVIRRNLHRLISSNGTHIICNNSAVYALDQLCNKKYIDSHNYKCILNSGEEINLDFAENKNAFAVRKPSLFCSDYSYWKNKRCYSGSDLIYNGTETKFLYQGDPSYTETRWCSTYESNTTKCNDSSLCLKSNTSRDDEVPTKLLVTLNGAAKDAQSGVEGIYSLGSEFVNGKAYWLQEGCLNVLWYDKDYKVWNIGDIIYFGTSASLAFVWARTTDDSVGPLEATWNSYKDKNGKWIQATDFIILSPVYSQNASASDNECSIKDYYYFCPLSKIWIPEKYVCDGAIQCIEGDDETFDLCKDTFPESATITCLESDRPFYNITIKATPCDGIVECRNGEDENCELKPPGIFYIITGCLVTIIFCIWIYRYRTLMQFIPLDQMITNIVLDPEVCKKYKGIDLLKLKNEVNQRKIAELLETGGIIYTSKQFLKQIIGRKWLHLIFIPSQIVLLHLDMIKDFLLLTRMIISLGGILVILEHYYIFSSSVVFLFLGSIIIPLYLAGARIAFYCPQIISDQKTFSSKEKEILHHLFLFLISPIHTIILHFKINLLELQLLNLPENEELIKDWELIKYHLSQFTKLDIGVETIIQLSGQMILLLNALSETSTNHGLDQIFRERSDVLYVLLSFSMLWSLKSCIFSNLTAMSAKREHFPIMSKLFAGLHTFFASTCKVLTIVIYFTPSLGLFNCLRHLQAEQTQWHPHLKKYFVINGTIQFGNAPPVFWEDIDRWKNVDGKLMAPHHTLYGYFQLKVYFAGFLILWLLQCIFIYIAKSKCSKSFKKWNLLEKLIHAIENSLLPITCEEWDSLKGNMADHIKQMESNLKEVLTLIIINFVFGMIHLIPICLLGYNVNKRHDFLWNSIGYLKEEQEAVDTITILIGFSFGYMIIGHVLQAYFFYLYNQKFHPFADILQNDYNTNMVQQELSIIPNETKLNEAKVNILSETPRLSGTISVVSTSIVVTPEHDSCLNDTSQSYKNLEGNIVCKEITHDVLIEGVFKVLAEKHGNE